MTEIVLPVMALKEALPGLNKVVPNRTTLPVLQHVRLARDAEGQISLLATDLDGFATYTAKEPLPGPALEMLLPLDQLSKAVKSLSADGTIGFIPDGQDKVKLRYSLGGSLVERTVTSLPAHEFPPLPRVNQPAIPLEPGFGLALRQALKCCSEDATRAILKGACLDVTDPKLHYVVGTNGRCLFSANSFCLDLKQSIVIPDCRFLQWPLGLDEEPATLSVEPGKEEEPAINGKAAKEAKPGWIKLQSGRWTFITREIVGKFPNWKQVMPESSSQWTRVQLSEEASKQLLLVTRSLPDGDSLNCPDRLAVQAHQIAVAGQNRDDDAWTSIPIQNVQVTGKPVTVALNRAYFTNALRFGLTELEIADPLSPVIFSQGGKRLIIMPIQLDGPAKAATRASAATSAPSQTENAPAAPPSAPEAGNPTEERTSPVSISTMTAPERGNLRAHHGNKGQTESEETRSAFKAALEQIDKIKVNLRNVIGDLHDAAALLKTAEKDQRASAKEIQTVRAKLKEIQSVAL